MAARCKTAIRCLSWQIPPPSLTSVSGTWPGSTSRRTFQRSMFGRSWRTPGQTSTRRSPSPTASQTWGVCSRGWRRQRRWRRRARVRFMFHVNVFFFGFLANSNKPISTIGHWMIKKNVEWPQVWKQPYSMKRSSVASVFLKLWASVDFGFWPGWSKKKYILQIRLLKKNTDCLAYQTARKKDEIEFGTCTYWMNIILRKCW